MSDLNVKTEAEAVAQLTANPIEPLISAEGDPIESVVFVRSDYNLESIEKFLPNRRRFRGRFQSHDTGAFFKYIKDNHTLHTGDSTVDATQVFVDAERMQATAYVDYTTNEGKAGHCDHLAVLTLDRTPIYDDVLNINGAGKQQRDAYEWIEDMAHALTFIDANKQPIETPEVLAAVQNMTVERARTARLECGQLSESTDVMDRAEAKAKVGKVPAAVKFTDPCYQGLEPVSFYMRFGVLTGGDQVRFKLDLINKPELEHERAKAFAELLESENAEHVVVRMGTFNP